VCLFLFCVSVDKAVWQDDKNIGDELVSIDVVQIFTNLANLFCCLIALPNDNAKKYRFFFLNFVV